MLKMKKVHRVSDGLFLCKILKKNIFTANYDTNIIIIYFKYVLFDNYLYICGEKQDYLFQSLNDYENAVLDMAICRMAAFLLE